MSHKCFVLTLKHWLTTNRNTNRRVFLLGRGWISLAGTQDHCLVLGAELPQQHLPLLQAFLLKISPLQDGLSSRTLSSPGTEPTWGTGGFHGRSQVLIYKMVIFFFHNSMLLHYQILSWGQYLIPEVLDVNERCFASGRWGLNQQAQDSCWPLLGNTKGWAEVRDKAWSWDATEMWCLKQTCMKSGVYFIFSIFPGPNMVVGTNVLDRLYIRYNKTCFPLQN